MYRAGGFIGRLFDSNGVDERIQLALVHGGMCRQLDLIDFVHQSTKYTALAAASGYYTFGGFFFNVFNAMTGFDGCCAHVPINRDGFNVVY